MSLKVALIELRTVEPVVVVSKKGKSNFVDSLRYIPASSILGAIARNFVLKNVANKIGMCSSISSPNEIPECDVCHVNCNYRKIWVDRCRDEKGFGVKVSNAVSGKWDLDDPSLPCLLTAGEHRVSGYKRDLLLSLFVEHFERETNSPNLLLKEGNTLDYKKKKFGYTGKLGDTDLEILQFGRVAISGRWRSSEKGYLYGFTAFTGKLRFIAVLPEEVLADIGENLTVGAWKSRGLGLVEVKVLKEMDVEEYVERRTKAIVDGFKEIGKLLSSYIEGCYGTYTLLTDSLKNIDLGIKYGVHRVRRFKRFERRKDGAYFIVSDVVSMGSAGVFEVSDQEVESFAEKLAELELKSDKPWFDWLFFNHPVHCRFSSLKEVA